MNIQLVRQRIREFLTIRVKIYRWDLDYPDIYYFEQSPACAAVELPVQNVVHSRDGTRSVKTSARFPIRLCYIFPEETYPDYHSLPIGALMGQLSNIHIYSLLQTPDSNIIDFSPVDVEDSLSVARTEDSSGDWLVFLNMAFDATFKTTEFSDISELQPPDYYQDGVPIPITELNIRTYRAKPGFSSLDNSTFKEDSNLNLNY